MASDSDAQFSQHVDSAEREFVRILIGLYRENAHLWQVTHPHYLDKNRRIRSLNKICEELRNYKPNYTVEHLKKKINILRTNFNKEIHKMEMTRKACDDAGGDVKMPQTNLWYYDDMLFLAEQGKLMSSSKTNSGVRITSQILNRRPLLKRRRTQVPSPVRSIINKDTETDLLIKCWTMKLQRLSPEQRIYAEKIINDTLFEAELGTLTRHGATFVTAPSSPVVYSTLSE